MGGSCTKKKRLTGTGLEPLTPPGFCVPLWRTYQETVRAPPGKKNGQSLRLKNPSKKTIIPSPPRNIGTRVNRSSGLCVRPSSRGDTRTNTGRPTQNVRTRARILDPNTVANPVSDARDHLCRPSTRGVYDIFYSHFYSYVETIYRMMYKSHRTGTSISA